MGSEMVCVFESFSDIEADRVKMLLEGEGIPCFLTTEHLSSVMPVYSFGVGGVQVIVNRRSKYEAEQLIEGFIKNTSDTQVETGQEDCFAGVNIIDGLSCPECSKTTVFLEKKSRTLLSLVLYLFSGYPKEIYQYFYKCADCGYEWIMKKSQPKENSDE